jgi:hypothetical protein
MIFPLENYDMWEEIFGNSMFVLKGEHSITGSSF